MNNHFKIGRKKSDEASFSTKPSRSRTANLKRENFSRIKSSLRPSQRIAALLIVIFFFLVGLLGGYTGSVLYNRNHSLDSTSRLQKQQYVSNESQLISQIAKDVGQSVVSVDVTSQSTTQDFFGFLNSSSQQSAGTGFIISSDGTIVTNRHVVP